MKHTPKHALLALLALPAVALAQDAPRAIEAPIDQVSVHRASAIVTRASGPLSADGTYLLRGLPASADPESVRVRCEGGHVLGVEVAEHVGLKVSDERMQELRDRLEDVRAQMAALRDRQAVLGRVRALLERIASEPAPADPEHGRPSAEAWEASHAFLATRLAENQRAALEAGWSMEDLKLRADRLEQELGRLGADREVRTWEATIELDVAQGASARLFVDYHVGGAGWRPEYELRTAGDARSVEVTYRARVHQRSGEDWEDVAVLLSTADARRGAQGPDPHGRWVGLASDRYRSKGLSFERGVTLYDDAADTVPAAEARPALGAVLEPPPFAVAEDEGLTVRYRLPRRETVESRDEPTTVLVGQARLDLRPEHHCVPARDTTVWLRGVATNTTDMTLLPGRAAVFFGEDFLGHAGIEAVQPGAELTLHLGAVPQLTVERMQTVDEVEKPGFLSSRKTRVLGWKLAIENHGARVCEPDGSVRLIVREALPRSTDERVEVDLEDSSPKPSQDARWKQDREELGIETWVVPVPRAGAAELRWKVEIAYPKSLELRFR